MKFIHNTTFVAERSVAESFVDWANEVYIVAARESGIFSDIHLLKILVEVDPSAINYAVQMRSNSLNDAGRWLRDTATLLHDDLKSRFGDKILYFSTDMEVIG